MDFGTVTQTARAFIDNDTSCELQLIKVDEEQSQLHFAFGENNFEFFLTCPLDRTSAWSVWSDDPKAVKIISLMMDRVELQSCDVHTILASIIKFLKSNSCLKTDKSSASMPNESKDQQNKDEDSTSDDENEDDDEEDSDDYYGYEDADAEAHSKEVKQANQKQEELDLEASFFSGGGNQAAVRRIIKDLKGLNDTNTNLGVSALPRGNNVFVWDVKITDVPENSRLGKDLKLYAEKFKEDPVIQIDMQFPPDYPFSPPFIRVIKPRFKFLTGHVTIGGSVCMQMLTKSGWTPTNDIESILVQVRTEILSDPNASLDSRYPNRSYSEEEAREAFKRMVEKYDW